MNASLPVLLDDGSHKYVWGIGPAFAVDSSGNPVVYHSDGLGSVRALTDSSGHVVQTYQYDEYGNVVSSSGSITQPFQYTGEQFDAETGFLYLRARMYDPASGKFTSRDDYSGRIVTPQSLHRYAYVQDSPVTFSDPGGHCGPLTPLCLALAAAGETVEDAAAVEMAATVTATTAVTMHYYGNQMGQGVTQLSQAAGELIAAAKKKLKPGYRVGGRNILEQKSPWEYSTGTGMPQQYPQFDPDQFPHGSSKLVQAAWILARLLKIWDNWGKHISVVPPVQLWQPGQQDQQGAAPQLPSPPLEKK